MTRFSTLIGATATAITLATSAFAQDVTLRLHQFLPLVSGVPANAIEPWIAKVEADSNGRIKIEHYPSMQLGGSPASLYNQARDGVVDIIWTLQGYTPGRFPKSEVVELPFMTGDAETASRQFHEYIVENAMDEYADTHPLAFHVHGPGWLHTQDPVESLEDLEGMTVRGPTRVITNLLEALGATAVGMPVPAVPEAVSKGVIDGAALPWEVTIPLKISELVSNHAGFADEPGLYTAAFVFTMNKDSYDALPDDLKAVIDANSGPELAAMMGRAHDVDDIRGREIAEANGNSIIELNDEERAKFQVVADSVVQDWIADMAKIDIDGQAVIDAIAARLATSE